MFPIRDHNQSHKFPAVTLLLILINSFVFFFLTTEAFIFNFALIPAQIDFSNIYSLYPFISSMYLHGGLFHLLSNMWFLWIFGDNIEASLGHITFFLFYTLCGIGAAALQYFFNPASEIPMLGASGAIAGVLGSYLVFFPKARIETLVASFGGFLQTIQLPATIMLGYWFVLQLFSGAVSLGDMAGGGVAFWAHVGGFVVGWFLAQFFGGERSYSSLGEYE